MGLQDKFLVMPMAGGYSLHKFTAENNVNVTSDECAQAVTESNIAVIVWTVVGSNVV